MTSESRVLSFENVQIDLDRGVATRNGEPVPLTRTEWSLVRHLAANACRVILNSELLTSVWGPEYRDEVQYLRVWISRIRRKLEPDPKAPTLIKTMQGVGYMLDAAPAPGATPGG